MNDPHSDDPGFDPDRLVGCAYWRCGDIFEQRTANHLFCRKACRSRQRKWERSQARKRLRAEAKTRSTLAAAIACGIVLLCFGGLAAACSSSSSDDSPADTVPAVEPSPAAEPDTAPERSTVVPRPPGTAVASDLVPTVDELIEIGLTQAQAECFIAEIDPESTGRVASAELFTAAFTACLT